MAEITFSHFLYLDTNILGILASDLKMWRPMQDFLHEQDLCIAVSSALVSELNEARHLHENINTLLTAIPSVLIKTQDVVLSEEIKSHPKKRTDPLVLYHLNALFLKQDFRDFLSSRKLSEARQEQRLFATKMGQLIEELKSNFPPLDNGKYSWIQAEEFVWRNTIQWLADENPQFFNQFMDKLSDLVPEIFLTLQIRAYALFYKYCLHGKKVRASDWGDLFHLYAIPYCELAIIERDMSDVLNHVKSNHKILENVTITNVEFFRDWEWNANK